MGYLLLATAIVFEVIGTMFLKVAFQSREWWPIAVIVVCYAISFGFVMMSLARFPIGFVYAVWAGAGIALVAIAGVVFFGEKFDTAGIAGLAMIVGGVVVLNTMSSMAGH